MAGTREAIFQEYGRRLKAIRDEIRMTTENVSKETGISRSYISDFERGYRLPTSKYLRYLHDQHNINLNYIFCGDNRKRRPTDDEAAPDFGTLQEEVDKLLEFMAEMPHALYAVLGFVTEYKIVNRELIEKHRKEKSMKNKGKKPDEE